MAVGPGVEDAEGNQQPVHVTVGSSVLYSRYTGTEFEVRARGEGTLMSWLAFFYSWGVCVTF